MWETLKHFKINTFKTPLFTSYAIHWIVLLLFSFICVVFFWGGVLAPKFKSDSSDFFIS